LEKNERQSASWDLKNAFGNYATLVVSQIAVAFFSFASVTLCTRTLGAEGYGGIVAVIAASSVAQIFVNWTCVGLARFGVEEFVDSGKISKSFWARTIIFLPNTLIFLAFSLLWFPLLANWLKLPNEAFWLVVLHFVVSAVWLHVQHAFQGAKLPKLQGSFLAIERVLIFGILVILILTNNLTWLSAVWAYIFPPALMTIIGLWQIRNLVSWKFELDAKTLKKMFKFSVPLIPFTVIGYLSTNYLDAIFISQYLNKTELGIYFVAYQINGILMQFPILAGSLLMPLFVTVLSKNQDSFFKKYLADVLPLLTLIWSLACVLVAILGSFFLPFVFGKEVSNAKEILWILVISSSLNAPLFFGYSPFSNAVSATYIGTALAIASALTNFTANLILIPRFGLVGCAWATVLSSLVSLVVVIVILRLKFSLKIGWIFQSTLLSVIVCSVYSYTNNYFLTAFSFIFVLFFLALVHRKSILQSFELFKNYRSILVN
jgi:O-antigen/teichoic acid export membrane protein